MQDKTKVYNMAQEAGYQFPSPLKEDLQHWPGYHQLSWTGTDVQHELALLEFFLYHQSAYL
jgi:hypothetical protein